MLKQLLILFWLDLYNISYDFDFALFGLVSLDFWTCNRLFRFRTLENIEYVVYNKNSSICLLNPCFSWFFKMISKGYFYKSMYQLGYSPGPSLCTYWVSYWHCACACGLWPNLVSSRSSLIQRLLVPLRCKLEFQTWAILCDFYSSRLFTWEWHFLNFPPSFILYLFLLQLASFGHDFSFTKNWFWET